MPKITKENLIGVLAKKVCCSKKEAIECLNVLLGEIKSALKKGSTVTLTGFGTFTVAKRKARTGRNPRTGAPVKIPAMNVPRFKAGKDLKKAVR